MNGVGELHSTTLEVTMDSFFSGVQLHFTIDQKNLVVEKKPLITSRDKNRSFDSLLSKNSEIISPFKTSPYLIRR